MAAADFFEFSYKVLFRYLLGWDFDSNRATPTGGILGFIRAFYGTTEFTECGSLHGHFLIWLDGGQNPSVIHDCLCESSEYQARFFAFFEDIIHHHLPDTEDIINPKFEPHMQRPPKPPESQVSLEVVSAWECVYVTKIK